MDRVLRCIAQAVVVAAIVTSPADAQPIALGAYIPGASQHPGLIDRFARETGREPVIVNSFKNWSSLPFNRAEFSAIWRRGGVPMITWEPWTSSERGIPLRAIAAGRFDRYLHQAAGSAALWGRPLFVRFAQEMNGPWFPWGHGVRGNTARDFRRAWKHVVDVFRRDGAANVVWVWSPNADSGGRFPPGRFYPGDEWVDWVAIDGFNFGGSEGWPSFTRIFAGTYNRLVAFTSRPMMIAETASSESGGEKAAWIASALGREAPRFSHLRALVWFDRGDFRVNSTAASLRAFREAVTSPTYATTRRGLLGTSASLPGHAAAPQPPESGYGAPSFLERLWRSLHGKYAWIATVAAALVLVVVIGTPVALLRRSKHRKARL